MQTKTQTEHEELYIIPQNYKENGRILGIIEHKSFYTGLMWLVPIGYLASKLPIDNYNFKVAVVIVVALAPALFIMLGINDEPLINYIQYFLRFNSRRKVYLYKK